VYRPEVFDERDVARLHALMREHAFALLVTMGGDGPVATHVPLLLDAGLGPLGTLVGHVARANPHWRAFDGATPALAVFQGPHAFVAAGWYGSPRRVPTWNYVAVHASGRPRVLGAREPARAALAAMFRHFEPAPAGGAAGGDFDPIPPDHVERLLDAIVAFELPIERLEGTRKLGQNQPPPERARVAAALRASGRAQDAALAALMDEAADEAPRSARP
jgi:transcriptional regulator